MDERPPAPQPLASRRPRRWLIVAIVLVCIGCPASIPAALFSLIPPYGWRGWVDSDRRVPPPWHIEMPAENARVPYDEMLDLMPPSDGLRPAFDWAEAVRRGRPTGADEGERARDAVERCRAALARLHEGADKRYALGDAPRLTADGPSFGPLRSAARLATAAAMVDLVDGRDDQALATLEDVTALGTNLQSGESLLQFLSGASIVGVGHAYANVVLRQGQPSPEALRAHALRVRQFREGLPGLRNTLCYEAALMDQSYDMIEQGGRPAGSGYYRALPNPILLVFMPKLANSRAWVRDRYARLVEEVDKPAGVSRYEELCADSERAQEARHDYFAVALTVPKGVRTKRQYEVAQLVAEETSCALELHKREHGAYPETLDALVPAYMPDLPVDPFTEEGPLVYRPVDGGYLLYALGPNMVDDGGVSATRYGFEPDLVLVDDRRRDAETPGPDEPSGETPDPRE